MTQSLTLSAQKISERHDAFYYYKEEQISLELNTEITSIELISASTSPKPSLEGTLSRSVEDHTENLVDLFNASSRTQSQGKSKEKLAYAELNLNKATSEEKYYAKLDKLSSRDDIYLASPAFKLNGGLIAGSKKIKFKLFAGHTWIGKSPIFNRYQPKVSYKSISLGIGVVYKM